MDFLVNRKDLHEFKMVDRDPARLESGQALLEIDSFGLTSNNITYGVFGEAMHYWWFFPAEGGWGRIPVWGFAKVAETANDELPVGTRVYGYLPPSSRLVIEPDRFDRRGFVDASPHRAHLPSAYQGYRAVDTDPVYDPEHEDEQILLWPLFFTSWLIDDFLADEGFFGAEAIVIGSASSKTALSAAFLLAQREGIEVIGLTSPRNTAFVEKTGVYSRVVPYEEIGSLPRSKAVYVDMSGSANVRSAVHQHYGDDLAYSCAVGMTHHEELEGGSDLPGPKPAFFFAPVRIKKRGADWGAADLDQRVTDAWHPFAEWTGGWLEVIHGRGPEALKDAYLEVLDGKVSPAAGHVLAPS
ncbi:MAG: DUF2855 family protein [Solirubrobacterales bacterium]